MVITTKKYNALIEEINRFIWDKFTQNKKISLSQMLGILELLKCKCIKHTWDVLDTNPC